MRVVFMGTPQFAVPSLAAVAADHDVAAVYTRPDAVSGRGSALRPSAVKAAALELGLPVRQPKSLRDPTEHQSLAELSPDVIVVAAYGLILPPSVLAIPPHGCVNVHASLLPRWRGAAPIQRAILAGDEVTGVSIMRMEEGLDTGPYCATVQVEIDDKSAEELTGELAEAGAGLLGEVLGRIERDECDWVEQNESQATYAEKLSKSDVALSPELSAEGAVRRVRASSPQAPARAMVAGKVVTVLSATLADRDVRVAAGGVVAGRRELLLGLDDGVIAVTRVKPEGKGAMDAVDWARGARLDDSVIWERAL